MLRHCVRCHRLFSHERSHLCLECSRQNEHDYRSLRDHIRNTPGTDATQASQATGIDATRVMEFLRTRRISTRRSDSWKPHCMRCGTAIPIGRYCESCRETLTSGMSSKRISSGYKRHRGAYRLAGSRRRRYGEGL